MTVQLVGIFSKSQNNCSSLAQWFRQPLFGAPTALESQGTQGEVLHSDWIEQQEVYTPCVIAVFFITLPLCFKNLQNTKKFTVVIMWCRFLAISILLIVGVYKSIVRFQNEDFHEIMQDVPLWKPSGFVAVFGNSVFLCGIHHYLPSMFPGSLTEFFFLISAHFYGDCGIADCCWYLAQGNVHQTNQWFLPAVPPPRAPLKPSLLFEPCWYAMTRGCHHLILPNFCANSASWIWQWINPYAISIHIMCSGQHSSISHLANPSGNPRPPRISPLEQQTQAPSVIGTAFSSCYLLILAICGTALVAWGNQSWSSCSSMPGGHYCHLAIKPVLRMGQWQIPWKWMIWGYHYFREPQYDEPLAFGEKHQTRRDILNPSYMG